MILAYRISLLSMLLSAATQAQVKIDSLDVIERCPLKESEPREILIEFSASKADSISLFYVTIKDQSGKKLFKLLENSIDYRSIYIAKSEGFEKILLKIPLEGDWSTLIHARVYVSDINRRYSNDLIFSGL